MYLKKVYSNNYITIESYINKIGMLHNNKKKRKTLF